MDSREAEIGTLGYELGSHSIEEKDGSVVNLGFFLHMYFLFKIHFVEQTIFFSSLILCTVFAVGNWRSCDVTQGGVHCHMTPSNEYT